MNYLLTNDGLPDLPPTVMTATFRGQKRQWRRWAYPLLSRFLGTLMILVPETEKA